MARRTFCTDDLVADIYTIEAEQPRLAVIERTPADVGPAIDRYRHVVAEIASKHRTQCQYFANKIRSIHMDEYPSTRKVSPSRRTKIFAKAPSANS